MLVNDFYELVRMGKKPVVKFTSKIEDYLGESIDPFMMGKIIDASQENEESFRFLVDMTGFEIHNKSVANHNWLDENGNAVLTYLDTEYYPKDGIDSIYLPIGILMPLEIVEDNSLLDEYISMKSEKNYVAWLEEMLMRCRKTKDEMDK